MACSIPLTKEGVQVQLVTESQKESCCEFITIVTGSMSMGANTGHDAEGAINKVRNKIALIGGNGMRVIGTNSNIFSSTVTAEALRCYCWKSKRHQKK